MIKHYGMKMVKGLKTTLIPGKKTQDSCSNSKLITMKGPSPIPRQMIEGPSPLPQQMMNSDALLASTFLRILSSKIMEKDSLDAITFTKEISKTKTTESLNTILSGIFLTL